MVTKMRPSTTLNATIPLVCIVKGARLLYYTNSMHVCLAELGGGLDPAREMFEKAPNRVAGKPLPQDTHPGEERSTDLCERYELAKHFCHESDAST